MGISRLVKAIIFCSMPLLICASGCLKLRAPSTPPPPKYMETKDTFELLDVETTTQPSAIFVLDGKPFCFGGANNYYMTYKSRRMVDDVLDRAKELHLSVIRIWGFINIGSLDGSVRALDNQWEKLGTKDGVYFQYWDPVTKRPMLNEGENGLPRLDYVVHAARERGLKVIITFANNWMEFGGIDQYIIWYGLKYHHQFYTDDNVKQAYRDWVKALVLRENTVDDMVYRDDPAIFSWELINEGRCLNEAGEFNSLEGWDATTMVKWVEEMSRYLKELDPNHMVSVGDEGFLDSQKSHWTYDGHQGVDHEALSSVETVDYATFHFYPDDWGTGYKFGYEWIEDQIEAARRIGKPTVMEEYGAMVRRDKKTFEVLWGWERRKTAYTNWLNILREQGGNGMLVWMLGGVDDVNGTVPDYDGNTIYKDEPSSDLIKEQAILFETNAPACKLAGDLVAGITPSPFVSAVRLKK